MALACIDDALTQYNANIPWSGSIGAARSCLEAVQYLLINRVQSINDKNIEARYESLLDEKHALEKFLGATSPRSFGRSRRNIATFPSQTGAR